MKQNRVEFLQGTLDMLVLRTLVLDPAHGHTIAHVIERGSADVLQVKAKYYRLTPGGDS